MVPSKKNENIWVEHPYRRTYKKIDFIPSLGNNDREIFNLYRGNRYPRDSPEVKAANPDLVLPWMNCICDIWCNGDEKLFHYTIRLLAYYFQYPGIRPDVCLILQSEEGAGKGVPIEVFGKLFAPHYKFADKEHAFGKFNESVLKDSLLVFLDKTAIKSAKQLDKFKTYITSHDVVVEQKYKAATMIQNYSCWIVATNQDMAVKLLTLNR